MEEKVLSFVKQHQLIQTNTTIIVGVSGGPDSIALLHLLHQWKLAWRFRLIAVAVDHQLRDEASKADTAYVAFMCEQWKIPCVTEAVDVRAFVKSHHANQQVAARTLRYQVYEEQMKKFDADYLALGHHGDDQIESLVMSLMRTTSLSGLKGIPLQRPFANGQLIRPLLGVTKAEIANYCARHQLEPRIDASNEDTYYTRNYVRKYIVPKLKNKHAQLHQTVQKLSESLTEDEQLLMSMAEEAVKAVASINEQEHTASIVSDLLICYPKPLQRRVYRIILGYLYGDIPKQLSHQHEQIFLSLLKTKTNRSLHFPHNLYVEKSYKDIHLYFKQETKETAAFHVNIHDLPQTIVLPNGDKMHVIEVNEAEVKQVEEHDQTYIIPKAAVHFPLTIRNRQPGDRMRYEGLQGTKKIKDILIDEKIPRKQRDLLYIIADTQQILWLVGLRKNKLKIDDRQGYIVCEYEELTQHEGI